MARRQQRVQVRDLRDAPSLRPQASPVRGYFQEQPKRLPESDLTQVANALSDVNPDIQRALQQKQKVTTVEDQAEAQRKYRETQMALGEAVRKGEIREGQSPAFRRAWRQSHLRVKGKEFGAFLRDQYANSPVSNSTDPEAAAEFAQEQYEAFLEQNEEIHSADNIDMTEAFIPEVDRQINSLTQQHQQLAMQRTEKQARETLGTEINLIVDENLAADPGEVMEAAPNAETVEGARASTIASSVQSRIDEMIANGMNGTDANRIAIETLAGTQDPDLMRSVLGQIKTGSGTLGDTKAARETINQVEDQAIQREMRNYRFRNQLEDDRKAEARAEAVDGYTTQLMEALSGSSKAQRMETLRSFDPIEYAQNNGITDRRTVDELIRIDQSLSNATGDVQEDTERIQDMYRTMMDDPESISQTDIIDGIGEFYDVNRGMSILSDYKSMAGSDGAPKDHPYLNLSTYKTSKNGINGALKSLVDMGGVPELNATNAEFEFEMVMREYLQQNPEATKSEFLRESNRVMNDIVKHYNEVAENFQPGNQVEPNSYMESLESGSTGSAEATQNGSEDPDGVSSRMEGGSNQSGSEKQSDYSFSIEEINRIDTEQAREMDSQNRALMLQQLNDMRRSGELNRDQYRSLTEPLVRAIQEQPEGEE